MASAGVWGGAPSGVLEQSPWSGGQGRSHLKLIYFIWIKCPK